MKRSDLYQIRKKRMQEQHPYNLCYYQDFDFEILSSIMWLRRSGSKVDESYNDVIIMCDTETSKKQANDYIYDKKGKRVTISYQNHVVAWTISIRAFDYNIVTLYGHKPSSMASVMKKIHDSMDGTKTIMYFHNMSYDWTFLRKFLFAVLGYPTKQLNTKSHYPIVIQFENGIILKDSMILAQRSLDKWSKDMAVEHQKACGKWDYDKFRNQNETFTPDELEYIEHDTLAGVECIQATLDALHKRIYSIPYTATGIPREEVRKRGKDHNAHRDFLNQVLTFDQYIKAEKVYHGGYTHANRHLIGITLKDCITKCKDFASSYPYTLLAYKFPAEKFTPMKSCTPAFILENMENYAYMFKLIMTKVRLKNDAVPMPALQLSKSKTVNAVSDNGRILAAAYVEIYISEYSLKLIMDQYDYDIAACVEVEYARKDYLPRWFTDYVFECFKEKTYLKGKDPVLYAIAKAKLNSLYGMTVQKCIRENIKEIYYNTGEELDGDYIIDNTDGTPEEKYEKYLKKINNVLNYQIGIWVTDIAMFRLFELGKCCEVWVYSDTDSVYGIQWDEEALQKFNDDTKSKLLANGYGPVLHDGREYWLGVAEDDSEYYEYRVLGAKRYAGRSVKDNELHITVAGVPKKGVKCLNNDLNEFAAGKVFDGATTHKMTHTYFYVEDIYIDANGNETGDSIDLSPCDYLLDDVDSVDWEKFYEEEISIITYEEDEEE